MAIMLNNFAEKCESTALAKGLMTPDSSTRVALYDVSVQWRRLFDATAFKSDELHKWSEKEVAAARVMSSTLTYLRRIDCRNIEQLLKDVARRDAEKSGLMAKSDERHSDERYDREHDFTDLFLRLQ